MPPMQEPRLMGDVSNNHFLYNVNAHQGQGNAVGQPQQQQYQQGDMSNFFGQAQAMPQAQGYVQNNYQGANSSAPTNSFPMPNMPTQANQALACFMGNNNMPSYSPQIQNSALAPFVPQQQPAPMQAPQQVVPNNIQVQPDQIRPFGMEPQELLNYAVIVNILHNASRGNGNQNQNGMPNLGNGNQNVMPNLPPMNQQQNQHQQGVNQNQGQPNNQMMQPSQQGFMNGMQGFAPIPQQGIAAAAPAPQDYSQMQMMPQPPPLALNQTNVENSNAQFVSSSYEHTVSPSIPSEQNFNTGNVSLPSHVAQLQHVDPKIRCVPLWTNEDETRLSLQQCWLRKQIETFPASQRDVRRHTRGRNRVLELGQVGIQCIHCKNLPQEGRGKGSSYFPSSTKGIYQAAQNILAYHFKEDTCPIITQQSLQEMREAGSTDIPRHLAPKAGKSRSGGGKSFWEVSAVRTTGLVDTTVGIRYANDGQNYRPLESVTLGMTESGHNNGAHYCPSESVLVCREDKNVVTDFCFMLMAQFIPYQDISIQKSPEYSDLDWDPEDDSRRVGIVCRFCKGVSDEGKHRDGVFLSIKPSTMMRNKQMTKLHSHIVSCRRVPGDLKRNVINAKEMHLPQSDRLKRGWKKVFFENVSQRLKQALDAAGNSSAGETSRETSASSTGASIYNL